LKATTHGDEGNGTATLFASIEPAERRGIAECMPLRCHQDWIAFPRRINRETPPDLELDLIVEKPRAAQTPGGPGVFDETPADPPALRANQVVRTGRDRMPRFSFDRSRDITQSRIGSRLFQSVHQIVGEIVDRVARHCDDPTPFVWMKKAADIFANIARDRTAPDN